MEETKPNTDNIIVHAGSGIIIKKLSTMTQPFNGTSMVKRGRGRPGKSSLNGPLLVKRHRSLHDNEGLGSKVSKEIKVTNNSLSAIATASTPKISNIRRQTLTSSTKRTGRINKPASNIEAKNPKNSSVAPLNDLNKTTEPQNAETSGQLICSSSTEARVDGNVISQRKDDPIVETGNNKFADFMANMQTLMGRALSPGSKHDPFFKMVADKFEEMSHSKQENAKIHFLTHLQNIVNEEA